MKEEIRKLLNVPKEQRIAQYIYNQFRDYEQEGGVFVYEKGKRVVDKTYTGIDIFNVTDAEFIKRFKD